MLELQIASARPFRKKAFEGSCEEYGFRMSTLITFFESLRMMFACRLASISLVRTLSFTIYSNTKEKLRRYINGQPNRLQIAGLGFAGGATSGLLSVFSKLLICKWHSYPLQSVLGRVLSSWRKCERN